MKICLGCDHAAFDEKEVLKAYLSTKYEVVDMGTHSLDRCNYPDYGIAVVKKVLKEDYIGILICGSGIGVSMVANRFKGIRAALCRSPKEAMLSRQHNNANILCLGARINTIDQLKETTDAFLSGQFEGGRHKERLALFEDLGERI
jgi:ribose 5-phosphate isomerase B